MENEKENKFFSFIQKSIKENIRQSTMIIALLAIWLIFTFLTNFIFISPRNLSNLFLQSNTIAILACGMTLVLVAGHLDLSVGSVAGFIGAIAAVLQVKLNMPTIPTILLAMIVGGMVGVWHGYWVAHKQIPAFIVTLASMIAFRGAILGITGGQTIGPMKDSFKAIGQDYLPSFLYRITPKLDQFGNAIKDSYGDVVTGWVSIFGGKFYETNQPPFNDISLIFALIFIALFIFFQIKKRQSRIKYGFKVLPLNFEILKIVLLSVVIALFFSIMIFDKGIPYAILLVIGLTLLFSFISNNTPFGRHLYAIGGNAEAAKLSGINIKQRLMSLFVIMGVMTAIAGVVFTSRLNAATTSAGQNFELDAIAAAIIGGSTMGGVGTIFGSIIGALVMASLDNGMSLMNLDVTYQYIIKGLILLLAVWADIATRKKA